MRLLSLLMLSFLFSPVQAQLTDAQAIVDKAIRQHGGKKYEKRKVSFDFRDIHYTGQHKKDGSYQYQRQFTDKEGQEIVDILTNQNFNRTVDGKTPNLEEKKAKAYQNSVNSVLYFSLLPYRLNEAAVQKKHKGTTTIKGETYHVIEVTFAQSGGGDDFDDVYHYWIHTKNYTVDYLAYSFHIDGGGIRFRSANNPRRIGGIRWQDYVNYKWEELDTPLSELPALFEQGKLMELSKIELENVVVTKS